MKEDMFLQTFIMDSEFWPLDAAEHEVDSILENVLEVELPKITDTDI